MITTVHKSSFCNEILWKTKMKGINYESKMGYFMKRKIITTYITWTNLYIIPQFKKPKSEANHLYNPQKLYAQDTHKLNKSYISTSNSKIIIII